MINKHLYRFIQLTWGFPQTFLGFILYLINFNRKHEEYNGCILTYWRHKGGISLGLFIFIEDNEKRYLELRNHEYGHTIQSLLLGPMYLLVVGLPSLIWCFLIFNKKAQRNKNISYLDLYCEAWAEKLGNKFRLD